jgi:hypothetical protein
LGSSPEHQHILGGIMEVSENRFAFFLTKHSLVYHSVPAIGGKVKVNLKTIRAKNKWTEQVPFVAISIFSQGDVMVIFL